MSKPSEPGPTRYAFVLIPRFNMMALTTSIEPLRVANYISGRQLYEWEFLSIDGQSVTPSNGMPLAAGPLGKAARCWDAVFVCGSWNSEHFESTALFGWLRQLDRLGVPLGAMCIGAYILARAKLLSGYKATVHWHCLRAFAENFPQVEVQECLFVVDRNRMTAAGGTSGLDMMLQDVKQRYGAQLAHEVADQILYYPVRGSESPQRMALGGQQEVPQPLLRQAIRLMEENLEEPLAIPELATRLAVSQRKLERLFQKYIGVSAVGFYRLLRLEFARVLLTHTALPVREVSVASGFASLSHFAKSFSNRFGKRPRDCRDSWPQSAANPDWPGMTASIAKFAGKAQQLDDVRSG